MSTERDLLAKLVETYFRDVEGDTVADEDRLVRDRDQEVDDLMSEARKLLESSDV